MVALFVVSIFFTCESEEVSPINPSASNAVSAVKYDQTDGKADKNKEEHIKELDERLNNSTN